MHEYVLFGAAKTGQVFGNGLLACPTRHLPLPQAQDRLGRGEPVCLKIGAAIMDRVARSAAKTGRPFILRRYTIKANRGAPTHAQRRLGRVPTDNRRLPFQMTRPVSGQCSAGYL